MGLGLLLPLFGGEHSFLDSAVTLLGIFNSFLTMLAYMEYASLMVISNLVSAALYISMLSEHPEQATYLIYTLYSLTCCIIAFFRIRKLYAEQQKAGGDNLD